MKKYFFVFFILLIFSSPFLLVKLRTFFPWSVRSRIEMVALQGDIRDKRFGRIPFTEKVDLQSRGVKMVGDLFQAESGNPPFPAIILLHGSSRWGRKTALIQLLAEKLAKRGYVTLPIDLRGFGESDDPAHLNELASWDDVEHDVHSAVKFLLQLPQVDKGKIYIIGHSMGGSYAIYSSIKEEKIKKIVAIGPDRRFQERLLKEKQSFLSRFSYVRRLPQTIPMEIFIQHKTKVTLEHTYTYFTRSDHKPIFLIDGELESRADKKFLQNYFSKMTPPKKYMTLRRTGHYLDVVGFEVFENIPLLWRLMIYDQKVISSAVETIDTFLKRQHGTVTHYVQRPQNT